ncbi:secreted protein C-like [Pollicipes pollicipes]|uniref:secreted protein C-like n=1 Tax=Pollicipes pollicipes TaxID=41117 RepID=UPI00188549DB|nr:secreted protein C-like [Pollicipes pollicipes]
MKTVAMLFCLVAGAVALPQGFFPGGLFSQNGQATGSAAGNVVSGVSGGPFQNSRITQVSATASGSASGNAVSSNVASASNVASSGLFGNQEFSNTNAVSNQQTFGGGLSGSYQRPIGQFRRQYRRPNFY